MIELLATTTEEIIEEATEEVQEEEEIKIVEIKPTSEEPGLCEKRAGEAIKFLNEILEKGKDVQEFTKAVINYLRQGLILKIGVEPSNPIIIGLTNEEQLKLQAQVAVFTEPDLRNALKLFMEAENKMKYCSIPQLPLELAIIEALKIGEK